MNDFIYEFYFSKKLGIIERVCKRFDDGTEEDILGEDAEDAIATMLGESYVYEEKENQQGS